MAFPSSGAEFMTSTCRLDRKWSLDTVEDCEGCLEFFCKVNFDASIPCLLYVSVMPCSIGQIPATPEGGMSWFNISMITYSCPPGKMFADGSYPFFYSECSPNRQWTPEVLPECIRKNLENRFLSILFI